MTIDNPDREQQKKELLAFLGITFGATFILELAGIAVLGPKILASPIPALAMFIPAIAAIVCMAYFRSPALTRETKLFFALFLCTVAVMAIELTTGPVLGKIGPYPALSTAAALAGVVLVVALNLKADWQRNLENARLSFGRNRRLFLIIPAVFCTLFILGFLTSYALGLRPPLQEFSLNLFFTMTGIALAAFVITWPVYFGEEYGWRYYLQERLLPLFGGYKGILLVGFIWGLWHAPLMMMGMNFPAEPFLPANLVYLLYTVIMSVIFGYAVIKTGSIWIAVLLHALTDMMVSPARAFISGGDTILSFLPLVVLLGILALVLLRSGILAEGEAPREEKSVEA
jgi:membrane protease YdiL (CAAX protease family)